MKLGLVCIALLVIAGIGVAMVRFAGLDSVRQVFEEWFVPGRAVAVGTGVFALTTYLLARKADAQAEVMRQQYKASYRPIVLPVITADWAHRSLPRYSVIGNEVLILRNGGPGPALRVRGEIQWRMPGQSNQRQTSKLLGSPMGPRDDIEARVVPKVGSWSDAKGWISYADLKGCQLAHRLHDSVHRRERTRPHHHVLRSGSRTEGVRLTEASTANVLPANSRTKV